jgi:hypothetical protein
MTLRKTAVANFTQLASRSRAEAIGSIGLALLAMATPAEGAAQSRAGGTGSPGARRCGDVHRLKGAGSAW